METEAEDGGMKLQAKQHLGHQEAEVRNGLFLQPLEGRWLPASGFYISSLQNFDRTNLHFSKPPWLVRHCHNGPRTRIQIQMRTSGIRTAEVALECVFLHPTVELAFKESHHF